MAVWYFQLAKLQQSYYNKRSAQDWVVATRAHHIDDMSVAEELSVCSSH
jgi:hypothetical protein